MTRESEIRKRLDGAIDRLGLSPERERMARYTVDRLVPEVLQLLKEQEKSKKGA